MTRSSATSEVRLDKSEGRLQGDLLCFSHLRWNWVFQRPQHLLTRAARDWRTFFFEEPLREHGDPYCELRAVAPHLFVVVPHLPHDLDASHETAVHRELLDRFIAEQGVRPSLLWYYTPMALPHTAHLSNALCVFDCMDELSAFADAPPTLPLLERQLLARCDVVFTGGWSLYEAKASLHPNCHAMPSGVDIAHFRQARNAHEDPADHRHIPHPRIGYCGVIDERLDLGLIAGVADARPDWHLVFVGPVTKIDPESLPQRPNIHYMGQRDYSDLPASMAAWDVAWMPFALNDSTRFISPTKTPEYLAAGRPVVSTPVRDVVRSWGDEGLVRIASSVDECVAGIAASLSEQDATRLPRVDRALAGVSWDSTWKRMLDIMQQASTRAA